MTDALLAGTITSAFGLIATCFAGYISYKMAQLKTSADRADVHATEAAVKVDAVQTQLIKTADSMVGLHNEASKEVTDKLSVIHDLVNSGMMEQKRLTMMALVRVADLTRDPRDIALADAASAIYNSHKLQQEKADKIEKENKAS